MTVREIVRGWLLENNFEGLCTFGCGCSVDDLMPCEAEGISSCQPGVKVPCDPDHCEADGDCPWHIGEKE